VPEIVKRLKPLPDTVRHLFAHSGNVCAFDGCDHPLIDEHSNFVAELCHIEAVDVGGERFNAAMSNEERRYRENLILLCHRHHVETNNVDCYPVARMREIKAAHEAKFAAGTLPVSEEQYEGAAEQIAESSIIDITKKAVVRLPQTLAAWEIPDDELGWDLELLHPYLERLRRLPLDTRGVLLVIVERGEPARDDVALPVTELELATGVRGKRLGAHLDMLDRHHIAGIEEDWEGRSWVGTYTLDGWRFWYEMKKYCEQAGLDLQDFIMGLRFDRLDEPPPATPAS
jgi:hypothetical protein